ncbi:MAG: hypothetical protein ACRDSM_02070 [Pseudonocardiaceae bacterium]
MSSLDYRAHAIDEDADHPYGVYVARCGHRLFQGTSLHDEPPRGGGTCPPCARWTEREDNQGGDPAAPRAPSSPGAVGAVPTRITRTSCYRRVTIRQGCSRPGAAP